VIVWVIRWHVMLTPTRSYWDMAGRSVVGRAFPVILVWLRTIAWKVLADVLKVAVKPSLMVIPVLDGGSMNNATQARSASVLIRILRVCAPLK